MIDLADPRLVTWGELDPGRVWSDDPVLNPEGITAETVVIVGESVLFRYDAAKAKRLVERCQELSGGKYGPAEFRVSDDLGHMHTPIKSGWNVQDYGFTVRSDPALPDNTVQLWPGD